jgi:hypothetical protein
MTQNIFQQIMANGVVVVILDLVNPLIINHNVSPIAYAQIR